MNKKLLALSLAVAAVFGSSNIVTAKDRTVINEGQTVTLDNESFDSLRYEYGNGGAIYSDGNLTINNSNFTNNSSFNVNEYQGVGQGGAIFSTYKGKLDINNSIFDSNENAVSGYQININNSKFLNNYANYNYVDFDYSSLEGKTSTQEPRINTGVAGGAGGGAAVGGFVGDGSYVEYLNINNSQFDSNSGSPVIVSLINTTIKNSDFTNNGSSAIKLWNVSGFISKNFGLGINTNPLNTIENSTFTNNSVRHEIEGQLGQGGAINNAYGDISWCELDIINSKFHNNSAEQGGAIYTGTDLNIISDNGTTEFKSNYIVDTNGNKIENNAIYVAQTDSQESDSVLTLTAKNNGKIYMYDNIDGRNGYNVNITGDGTGTLYLYNDIKNGDITTGNITIDAADGQTHNYNLKTLNSGSDTNYKIDVDLSGLAPVPDTFTVGEGSNGTVTITDVNYIGNVKEYNVQVLNAQDNNIQLAIGEDLLNKEIVLQDTVTPNVSDEVTKDAKWNDKFEKYTLNTSVIGNVSLDTTTTTNDSIKLTATDTKTTKTDNVSLGDTLALVNQLDTNEDRSFSFDTANDKYNVSSDLGTTTAGKLSINGEVLRSAQNDVIARSEINLNGHNGFELDNATTLNVNDTRLTGNDTLITINNQNAIVNLQNADLNGSIAAENSYKLNITGDTSDRTIINGEVGKANATHSGGELGFNTDTFKDAEFSTTAGTVDLVTGQVENYDIGKLTSDESANWIFEVDSSGSGADTLTVGTGSSGTVNVSEINFVNGDSPSDEFTVQVLNAQDDNIQLAVDSSIAGENHKLGTVTKTSQDTITPTAKWNQTFNKYTQNGTNYGNIDVATTNTTNDSLQLKVTSTEWDEKTISGSMAILWHL